MKTALIIGLVCIILLFVIAGCGQPQEPAPAKEAEQEQPKEVEQGPVEEIIVRQEQVEKAKPKGYLEQIEGSEYFDIDVVSVKGHVVEYGLTFTKDISVGDYWIKFESDEGEDYYWYCGYIQKCRIDDNDWTAGTNFTGFEKLTADLESEIEEMSGIFHFYMINAEQETREEVAIKKY
jgi:hypothetical protein